MRKSNFEILKFDGRVEPIFNVDWVDRVFIKSKGQGVVILKSHVKVTEKVKENFIYDDSYGDFIVHVKVPGTKDRFDAFHFSGGFTESDIASFLKGKILNASNADSSGTRLNSFSKLLVNQAFAETESSVCSNSAADLSSVTVQEIGPGIVRNAVGCLKGTFAGAWNSTGGAIVSVGKGLWSAVTHPVKAFRGVKASMSRMVSFVKNAGEEIQKLGAEFASLPSDIKSQVLCELGATVGVGVIINIATGGAAGGVVVSALRSALVKVERRFPTNKTLAVLTNKAIAAEGAHLRATPKKIVERRKHDDLLREYENLSIKKGENLSSLRTSEIILESQTKSENKLQILDSIERKKAIDRRLHDERRKLALKISESQEFLPAKQVKMPRKEIQIRPPEEVVKEYLTERSKEVGNKAARNVLPFAQGCVSLESIESQLQQSGDRKNSSTPAETATSTPAGAR